jgi:hypothetical protein
LDKLDKHSIFRERNLPPFHLTIQRGKINQEKGGRAMLLIIEILLTIAVWRKGWKGWALLPCGIMMLMAGVAGIVAALSGVDPESLTVPSLILDGLYIVSLCIMLKRAPRSAATRNEEPDLIPAETLEAGA